MSNYKIVFSGTDKSNTENHSLTTFANTNNEIYIEILIPEYEDIIIPFITLDKQTAIKLVKVLKSEISKLT